MKRTKLFFISFASLFIVFISGSGGSLSGTYVGESNSLFDKLVFTSGSKVDIYFNGSEKEGSNEKEGNKVKISTSGDNQIITIDKNGCLDGRGFMGTYCRQ